MEYLTNLQKEELDAFDGLIESKILHDRLVALFMINVTERNGFHDLSGLAQNHVSRLPSIAQFLQSEGMEKDAETLRVVAALFDVMSVTGVLTDRITTEQNRKAQNERHNRVKQELVPLMDELIQNIKHPVSVAYGADLFLDAYPEVERPHSTIQKLFKERREYLGYPSLPRGRPAIKNS
ncbi:hypothetical protein V3H25_22520 [Vibrio parahaemolyticus]|uniref:hypothetical protein n=1 Tax=Vibrio parahaemolyticus TaxID=670 RepID=UPI003B679CA0